MSYPPGDQQGYPPPYGGPPGVYPPSQGGYPPPQAGYPPPQGGYAPPQGGYAPPQGGYAPPQGGYAPPQGGYAPPQGGYPPPQAGYQPGYPPPTSFQPQPGYQPPGQPGYPPPGGYPQPGYGAPIAQQPTGGSAPQAPSGYYSSAIMTPYQPQPPGGWMNMPQGHPNTPPGLEYLTQIDQLLVHQKVELLEALTGFETKNKFTIKNSTGQKVYYAVEDSDCLTRNCCGPLRPLDMKILDNFKNEVIHMNRPLACDSCFFPCCLQSMEVSSPPGTVIGRIEQEWSILTPQFRVKNAAGDTVLRIEGPFCTFSICGDVEFKVMSKDGSTQVGKIAKQWAGLLREAFTDADHFGITFPMDLDVKMKAVMLGACFLIDFLHFEKPPRHNQQHRQPRPPICGLLIMLMIAAYLTYIVLTMPWDRFGFN